jgi:hypothetical protein
MSVNRKYVSQSPDEVIHLLQSDSGGGLSIKSVASQRILYGLNKLDVDEKVPTN